MSRAEAVTAVLADFGITSARHVTGTAPAEEVVLLGPADYASHDSDEIARAIRRVLPHVEVWVIEAHPAWKSEPLGSEPSATAVPASRRR